MMHMYLPLCALYLHLFTIARSTLILFTCACGHIACKVQHSHKEYEINAVSLWQTAARKMQLSISWKMHFYKPFFFISIRINVIDINLYILNCTHTPVFCA